MGRLARELVVLSCAAVLSGCGDDRHVIGRFDDERCAEHEGAILCSGFERPDLSEWTRTAVENRATVEQTDARAFGGRGSLHAESTGPASAAVVAAEFGPVTEGELFLRAYLYVPDGFPTEAMNVFFLGDVAGPDPFKGVDINLENGALSTYVPGNVPERFTSTALVIPRDRWFCFQLRMTVAPDAGDVHILVDGQVALEQLGMKTLPEAGVHLLRAGVDWSSLQTEPFSVYMDDLVLATGPIECD